MTRDRVGCGDYPISTVLDARTSPANSIAIRSSTDSLFTIGILSNSWLAAAVAGTVLLQLVASTSFLADKVWPLTGVDER